MATQHLEENEMNHEIMILEGWIEKFDGDVVSPKDGDNIFIRSGQLTVSGQTGGCCVAYDNAILILSDQTDGYCRAYDNATITFTSSGQTGGLCSAHDNAQLIKASESSTYDAVTSATMVTIPR
jgi:hypothetical protein